MITKRVLKLLPKIELHRHLEGAMRIETLREMAAQKKLTDYPYDDVKAFKEAITFGKHKPDFLYFLSKFINVWYSSLDDIERIAFEAVCDAAQDSIVYMELRVNLDHYALVNNFNQVDVLNALLDGTNRAKKQYKEIDIKYIFTLNRGKHTISQMKHLVSIAYERVTDGVCGVDLAGDEIHFPARDFSSLFEKIKEDGRLGITIHAGETTNTESVWDAIKYLHADRIGHGVKSIFDSKLVEYEVKNKITLELCPISNLQTGAVSKIEEHPFVSLYNAGVSVTLNSDDPTIQSSKLTDDYLKLHKTFDVNLDTFKQFNLNSIAASFQGDGEKKLLLEKYNAAWDIFTSNYVNVESN